MTWEFPHAKVISVHDGDNAAVEVDMGFDEYKRVSVRLLGLNAIELSKPGGVEARDNLASILPPGMLIGLRSVQWDKFGGRVDGYITLPGGADLGALLIQTGWAVPWDGRGKAPIPAWPRENSP